MKKNDKKELYIKLMKKEGVKFRCSYYSLPGSQVEVIRKYAKLYGYKSKRVTSMSNAGCFYEMLNSYVMANKD